MSLKIAFVQYHIIWEDVDANLKQLTALISDVEPDTDLILLPEMFATGFSMNTGHIAQTKDGSVLQWLSEMSKQHHMAIMGTQAISVGQSVFNRALFVAPDREVLHYDKRHLFSPGNEDENYSSGVERIIIEYKGVRILPQVCYDLRFPVWSRNRNEYDLAIYLANWPAARNSVWNTLLRARAIENQCYVVGVNRVGNGGGVSYEGDSQFVDFKGDVLLSAGNKNGSVFHESIDLDKLNGFRDKFPAYKDADDFNLIVK